MTNIIFISIILGAIAIINTIVIFYIVRRLVKSVDRIEAKVKTDIGIIYNEMSKYTHNLHVIKMAMETIRRGEKSIIDERIVNLKSMVNQLDESLDSHIKENQAHIKQIENYMSYLNDQITGIIKRNLEMIDDMQVFIDIIETQNKMAELPAMAGAGPAETVSMINEINKLKRKVKKLKK